MIIECPGCHSLRQVTPFKVDEGIRFCSKQCMDMPDGVMFRLMKKTHFGGVDACWTFLTSHTVEGYGRMQFNGKLARAHVLSYKINKGPVPEGMCVCHSCDNPPCINPDHLWLGTHKDNALDCKHKGRSSRSWGEINGHSKLKCEDIVSIRELHSAGVGKRALADQFGVCRSNVSLIVNRKRWRFI